MSTYDGGGGGGNGDGLIYPTPKDKSANQLRRVSMSIHILL